MNNPQFLKVAHGIARRLRRSAVWDGEAATWVGLKPVAVDGGFRHIEQPLGPDLYTGAAGTLLFLTRIFRMTGDKDLISVLHGAAQGTIREYETIIPPIRWSYYSGWSGIAAVLIELGETTADASWVERGLAIIRRLSKLSLKSVPTEVLLGVSGAIPILLGLYRRHAHAWLLDCAERLGEHVLAKARRRDIGWSWPAFGPFSDLHRDDLTGFAHGACGHAWSLVELYAATGKATYRTAAEEGFRFEKRWYREEVGNWLDVRYMAGPDGDSNNGKTCQIQWCYGAVGAGLALLRAFQVLGGPVYRAEAEAAIRTTLDDARRFPHNWQPNYSICHGLSGNADLLIEGSRILGNAEWFTAAEEIGRIGMERFENQGRPWPGSLGSSEIPGLMTGVAGAGHFLLRLYDPVGVPAVTLPSWRTESRAGTARASRPAKSSKTPRPVRVSGQEASDKDPALNA